MIESLTCLATSTRTSSAGLQARGQAGWTFRAWTSAGQAFTSPAALVWSKGGHSSEAEDRHVSWPGLCSGKAEQPPTEPLRGWISAEPAQPGCWVFPELHLLLINVKAP